MLGYDDADDDLPVHADTMQSKFIAQHTMQSKSIAQHTLGQTTLGRTGLDVAGNNTGSITKISEPTTVITPTFRTRKR